MAHKSVRTIFLGVATAAGLVTAAQARAQAGDPAWLHDSKVWFEIIDANTNERVGRDLGLHVDPKELARLREMSAKQQPQGTYVNDCWRLNDRWSFNVGLRYDSLEEGAAGPGTFTIETCATPEPVPVTLLDTEIVEIRPGHRDSWAVLLRGEGVLDASLPDDPPPASSPFVTLSLNMATHPDHRRRYKGSGRYEVVLSGFGVLEGREPVATKSSETLSFSLNGDPIGQEAGDTSAMQLNDEFDFGHDERGGGVSVELLLELLDAGETVLDASLGRHSTSLLFDPLPNTPGTRRTEWAGAGTAFELGLEQRIGLGRGMSLSLGAHFERLFETGVIRSPALTAAGGRITEDQGDLKRTSYALGASLGRKWGERVSGWVGAEARWDHVGLTGSAAAEFPDEQGLFEQRVDFINDFESNAVRPFAGVEVDLGGSLSARAQYVLSGSGSRLSLGLGVGWRRE